jgi:hypothetical protein
MFTGIAEGISGEFVVNLKTGEVPALPNWLRLCHIFPNSRLYVILSFSIDDTI